MKRGLLILLLPIYVFTGCGTLQKATMHGLSDGYYQLQSNPPERVYAVVNEDSIIMYRARKKDSLLMDSPIVMKIRQTPDQFKTSDFQLQKTGIDIDILTVLFKYRFSTPALPAQLNANLNLAGYLGYKKEFFRFKDISRPDKLHKNDLRHSSIDGGIFTGFGSTPLNPSTTAGHLQSEYDGIIWQYGVASFVGWNIFTFGVGLGFDTLLDSNRKNWIYNGKPWVGLLIGLTLSN